METGLALLRAGKPPLRLTDVQAIEQAGRLHDECGLSWRDIAKVMAVYHGAWVSHSAWRLRCLRTSS